MKKKVLIITHMLLVIAFCSFSQNHDSLAQATQDETPIVEEETNTEVQQQFIEKYEIGNMKGIRSKMLEEYELRSEPSSSSEKTGVIVEKGEIIFAYKYYSDKRCWAVKYGTNWGFVKDNLVFPVSNSSLDNKVSKFDEPPQLKTQIKPKYPTIAKKKGIKGKVYIKVYINEIGEATDVIILCGIDELNQAAIDAVKKAKYKPAKYKGEIVGVWVNLSISF